MSEPGRLTLLVGTHRVAPGLLSRSAWAELDAADHVMAADLAGPLPAALAETGLAVDLEPAADPAQRARALSDLADDSVVVWLPSQDGDPGLTDALALELSRRDQPPAIEVLVGSWDLAGSRVLDAVAVIDLLRTPGGCAWTAEQTHQSLVRFLVEEAYEAVDAIENGTPEEVVDELGDVLFQVLFHARLGQEEDPAYDIDDVAGGLVDKLVRRNPHVFAAGTARTPQEIAEQWEQIKAQERAARPAGRAPVDLPPLENAIRVVAASRRTGGDASLREALGRTDAEADLGTRLLELVRQADAAGLDAGAELRAAVRRLPAADQREPRGSLGLPTDRLG